MQLELIIEAGATKSHWFFIKQGKVIANEVTVGVNLTVQHNDIELTMSKDIQNLLHGTAKLTYYGAGVRNDDHIQKVVEFFKPYSIKTIHVYSDIMAAARAVCGEDKGIVIILGTGSNISYYDGEKIEQLVPSLGYVLGDDGAGSYIGKELIRAYFYQQMPLLERDKFAKMFDLSNRDFVEELYQSNRPASYLGQFAKFLSEGKSEWKKSFVIKIFKEFVDLHLIKNYKHFDVGVHFIGSIAFHFQDELREACGAYSIEVQSIIKAPEEELIQYHITKNE